MTETHTTTSRGCGPLSPRYSEALTWAATLHRYQVRKNTQVPYLAHLVAVSSLVLEDGGTETEAIAGLLHDAVEDCGVEVVPYLRDIFGDEVVKIVLECSDATPAAGEAKPLWAQRKQAYVDDLRTASTSALRVSAADKLHNARATVGDLRETGTWADFNACRHQSLWYYDAISTVLQERLPNSRTAAELDRTVEELYQLTADVERPETVSATVPECPATPACEKRARISADTSPGGSA